MNQLDYLNSILAMTEDALRGPVVYQSCAACHVRYVRRESEDGEPLRDLCEACIVEVLARLHEA